MVENRFENTQNNINQPEGLPFVTGRHCPKPRSSRFQFVSEKRKKKLLYIVFTSDRSRYNGPSAQLTNCLGFRT